MRHRLHRLCCANAESFSALRCDAVDNGIERQDIGACDEGTLPRLFERAFGGDPSRGSRRQADLPRKLHLSSPDQEAPSFMPDAFSTALTRAE
jgi:hypothetical protein